MPAETKKVRRGFTLVELLCVAAVLCALSGAALVFAGGDERRIVRAEAEDVRSWLSARMAQAAREGADFRLYTVTAGKQKYELTLEWIGGPKDLEREYYAPERTDIGLVASMEYTFSGEWFTLTPAASFIIRSRRDPAVRFFVTVSGAGYADVKETLEEQ